MIEYNEFEGNGNENSGRNDVGSGGSSNKKQLIEKKTANVVCCSISNRWIHALSFYFRLSSYHTHTYTQAHINTITYTNKTKPMSIIIYTADNAIANISKVANDSINSQKRLKTIILFSNLLQSVLYASLLSVDARVHAFVCDRYIQNSSQHCMRSKRWSRHFNQFTWWKYSLLIIFHASFN